MEDQELADIKRRLLTFRAYMTPEIYGDMLDLIDRVIRSTRNRVFETAIKTNLN